VDAIDRRDDFYGWDRLKNVLRKSGGQGADQIVESIERDVNAFTAGTPPFDDLTMVVVKRVE